jgi:c-di-GMP-binding flagellar brake protein YcgR
MVDAHLVDAVALDVSQGGVKIVTPGPIGVGTRVAVVLFVEGEIIDATARVCWSSAHGPNHFAMGLAFERIEDETRLHLSRFCSAALS